MIYKEALNEINGFRSVEVHPSLLFIILKGLLSGPAQLGPTSYAFSIIVRPRFLTRAGAMPGAAGCVRWGYIAVAAGGSLALKGVLVTKARKSIPNNLKQQLETDWPVGFQLCFKLAVMQFL